MKVYLVVERMPFESMDEIMESDSDQVGFLGSFAYRGGGHKRYYEIMEAATNDPGIESSGIFPR